MYVAGVHGEQKLAMSLETIRALCAKKEGPEKTVRPGILDYREPGWAERIKAECELKYRIKQQEANNSHIPGRAVSVSRRAPP